MTVHHEKEPWWRVHDKKERWGKSSPGEKERWDESSPSERAMASEFTITKSDNMRVHNEKEPRRQSSP